jgi:hypothetical protein
MVNARPSVRRTLSCKRAAMAISAAGEGGGSVAMPVLAIWRSMWSIGRV